MTTAATAQKKPPVAGTTSGGGDARQRTSTANYKSKCSPCQVLAHLHRGGVFAYYWTNPGGCSHWYKVGDPAPIPNNGANVYFGVHPTNEIPPTNAQGQPSPPDKVRSRIEYIAVINCLFGEFDAKDFDSDKSAALAHIDALDPAPSVVIDSGGGYHCYWLLRETYALTTESKRERARDIQARWVAQVGGDGGAKDLARVLRVPGTQNHKYPDKPTVTVIRADFSLLYDLDDLEACIDIAEWDQEQDTASSTRKGNGKASAWAEAALAKEIAILAQTHDGSRNRNTQLNTSAYNLGQIVGAGFLPRDDVEQALYATGRGVGLEERETLATIKSGIEAGMQKPRGPKEDAPERRQHARPMGTRIPSGEARELVAMAPESPDPEITARIFAALQGSDEEKKTNATLRRQKARNLMLGWLQAHGGFVRSQDDEKFFFYRPGRRVFNIYSDHFAAWLYALTGANPAGTDFAHLKADCEAAAIFAPIRSVLRLAAWDEEAQELRVSRFDGTVYVLDGETMREETNGETVLFDDSPTWTPYTPSGSKTGALYWHTTSLPNWSSDSDREAYGLALRAWIIGSLFTELCPTRPFAVMIGEKGSGKTMTLRLLLRFLFGPGVEVSGVPDKPDGFTAAAAAAHLLVLDNLDDFRGWMRDKLARLSTGAVDEYRKLYSNNEVGRVYYRCWLAFTSRTPDTLRRDDLADRLLLLPVDRLEPSDLEAERSFLIEAANLRGRWWGELLYTANKVVAAIRRGELQSQARLRMADWESLGRLVAQVEGMLPQWDTFIEQLTSAQADFLLEGDLLVDGIAAWMENADNHGKAVTSKMLHEETTALLFGDRKAPKDWPASTVSFGKRLAAIRRELCTLWRVEWGKGTERGPTHGRLIYQFWPGEASQEETCKGARVKG